MKAIKIKSLRNFENHESVEIGDIVQLHNNKEAIWCIVQGVLGTKVRGEIIYYMIHDVGYNNGDQITFDVKNILFIKK